MTRTHLHVGLKLDFSVHTKESQETEIASFMSMSNHQLQSLAYYGQKCLMSQ